MPVEGLIAMAATAVTSGSLMSLETLVGDESIVRKTSCDKHRCDRQVLLACGRFCGNDKTSSGWQFVRGGERLFPIASRLGAKPGA